MSRPGALAWLWAGLIGLAGHAHALVPAVLAEPNIDIGRAGAVYAMVTLSDRSVIVAGSFSSVYEPASNTHHARGNIARILANGSLDLDFQPEVSGTVRALAVDPLNRVYVGGSIWQVNGQGRSNLARIDGISGALDPVWNPYANEWITALHFDAGSNSLFAAGDFITIGGLLRTRLARLSADDWGPGIPSFDAAPNNRVWTLTGNGSSIYVGGDFTMIGTMPRNYLAKLSLDGSIDANWNPSPSHEVYALTIATGNTGLYVGGRFNQIGGQPRFCAARVALAATGAVDAGWNPGVNSSVFSIAESPYGWTYLGGAFTHAGGSYVGYATRVLAGGIADSNWVAGLDDFSYAVQYAEFDRIYVGGGFSGTNGRPASALAHFSVFNTYGGVNFGAESITVSINDLAAVPDGGAIVAGNFTRVRQAGTHFHRKHSFKLGADNRIDALWHAGADYGINALAVDGGGQVYAGGYFSRIDNQARGRLAKFSSVGTGAVDPTWNPGVNGNVHALVLDAGGQLVLGGSFNQVAGTTRSNLARVSISGTGILDGSFQVATDGDVERLALDPLGRLLVSGWFDQIGGWPIRRLARVSAGIVDSTWQPDPVWPTWAISPVTTHTYVGARFDSAPGRSQLARITDAGQVDSAWAPPLSPDEFIEALVRAPDGALHAAGQRWLRVDATQGSVDPEWQIDTNGGITRLLRRSNGDWLAAGSFTEVNGLPRRRLFAVANDTVFANGFE